MESNRQLYKRTVGFIKEYLRETSVIILGLCITYYGDSLVSDYMDRQEDREAMHMVQEELEYNLRELGNMQSYYRTDIQMSETLRRYLDGTLKGCIEDSITTFHNQHRLYHYWTLKDHAFKMVRESATMQRMDKEMLTHLFECYEYLDVVENMGATYREKRFEELLSFISLNLKEAPFATTTVGQWEQIRQDEKFVHYLTSLLPMLAKSTLSVSLYASELVTGTLSTVKEEYAEE